MQRSFNHRMHNAIGTSPFKICLAILPKDPLVIVGLFINMMMKKEVTTLGGSYHFHHSHLEDS